MSRRMSESIAMTPFCATRRSSSTMTNQTTPPTRVPERKVITNEARGMSLRLFAKTSEEIMVRGLYFSGLTIFRRWQREVAVHQHRHVSKVQQDALQPQRRVGEPQHRHIYEVGEAEAGREPDQALRHQLLATQQGSEGEEPVAGDVRQWYDEAIEKHFQSHHERQEGDARRWHRVQIRRRGSRLLQRNGHEKDLDSVAAVREDLSTNEKVTAHRERAKQTAHKHH